MLALAPLVSSLAALSLAVAGAPTTESPSVLAQAEASVAEIVVPGGLGSGFAITPALVLTAAHVVGRNRTIEVHLGGQVRPGRVQRASAGLDVALLSVGDTGVPTLPLRSNPVAVGETVYAVGNPGGVLSVTRGIVSGHQRRGGVELVQTDAAVNPGNSGGPLLDERGQVVGLVVSKIAGADGIGLAVSVDQLASFVAGTDPAPATAVAPTKPIGPSPDSSAAWYWASLALPAAGLVWLVWARGRRRSDLDIRLKGPPIPISSELRRYAEHGQP